MSAIRKTPYIEIIMAAMTDSNLKDLREILNSGGDNVKLSFATLTNSYKNKVTPVYFDFEDGKMKTAILIWTNSYCTLICYHRFQDLMLIELNPNNHTYEKINEDCDINELRRILDDTIQAKGIIESGGAAANTVLTADGSGGTSWEYVTDSIKQNDVEEGDAVKLFGFNENGDLVTDDIPEGILVDQTVIEDSPNAVAGGGVYDAIQDVIDGVEGGTYVAGKAIADNNGDNIEDTYAKKDGNYPTMSAGEADVAKSLKTGLGVDDETPFSYQTAGGSSDIETGLQELEKLVGCKLVKNQKIMNGNFATDTIWGFTSATHSIASNTLTFTATAQYGRFNQLINFINGHIYLFVLTHKGTTGSVAIYTSSNWHFNNFLSDVNDTSFVTRYEIRTYNTTSGSYALFLQDNRTSDWTEQQFKDIRLIDLTQMFGSNEVVDAIIGSDTSKQVANLLSFLGGWLPTDYDEGSFTECKSAKLKTVDYNQWDEETELGYWNYTTGQSQTANDRLRSKNFIRVISGAKYHINTIGPVRPVYFDYNKNIIDSSNTSWILDEGDLIIPQNVCYIKLNINTAYGTTYNNDICISLYWDGSRIGYEPYAEHVYNLPNQDLNGILVLSDDKVVASGDELYPDGTGSKKYDKYVFTGSESWTLEQITDNAYIYRSTYGLLPNAKNGSGNYDMGGATINNFNATQKSKGGVWGDTNKGIESYALYAGYLCISKTLYDNRASLVGKTIIYELATPEALAGTPFTENIYVDDFGTMQFLDEDGNQIAGLQGNKIFYKANIAGFAESVYAKTEGDPDDLVVQEDLVGYNKTEDLSSSITGAIITTTGLRVIKIGKLVTISGRLMNDSGSAITAGTALFKLPSSVIAVAGNFRMPFINGAEIDSVVISDSGELSCSHDIVNGAYLHFSISYAVA